MQHSSVAVIDRRVLEDITLRGCARRTRTSRIAFALPIPKRVVCCRRVRCTTFVTVVLLTPLFPPLFSSFTPTIIRVAVHGKHTGEQEKDSSICAAHFLSFVSACVCRVTLALPSGRSALRWWLCCRSTLRWAGVNTLKWRCNVCLRSCQQRVVFPKLMRTHLL